MSQGDRDGVRDENEADKSPAGEATRAEAPETRDDAAVAAEKPTKGVRAAPSRVRVTGAQWVFLAIVALTTAGLDLWTKSLAIKKLSIPNYRAVPLCQAPPGSAHYFYQRLPSREHTVIRNYLDMRYAENCGGAWGLLHGAREGLRKPFFLLVTIGAVAFIVHLYRTLEDNQRLMRWALPLVLGGAIGNLVDRVRLGYVVDFIDAHWKERYHWPTFNIADVAITVGIGLMLLEYILGPKGKPAPTAVAAK